MLELWGIRSTLSLPLFPGPLWPEMVTPCCILTFDPAKNAIQSDAQEGTHSNGSYERKLRGRKLANKMGKAKIPMVHS